MLASGMTVAGMLVLGLMRWCLVGVVAALALAGCTHDRSELYAPSAKSADAAVAKAELPILPMLPDPDVRAACEACAKDKCATARDNCLEDDDCTEILACKGKCSDPACLQTCDAKYGPSSWYDIKSATAAWYDDYASCGFKTACKLECNAGENFACAGHYDWPTATLSQFPVHFRVGGFSVAGAARNEQFLVGAAMRTCRSADSPCTGGNLLDSGRVDAMNGVTLNVIADGFNSYFRGFLEVEDERIGPFGWRERLLLIPLAQPMELGLFPPSPEWLQSGTGGQLDLQAGAPLLISIFDCLDVPARNVRVELPDLPGIQVRHYGDGNVLSAAAATTTGGALVTDVPEADRARPITVRAVQVGTERRVAETVTNVRAGWVTSLWWLTPRTR